MSKREKMSDASWFDSDHGWFLLDERVAESPEFRIIMADSVVTDIELMNYSTQVTELLKKLDTALPSVLHKQVGDALSALAVLHALKMRYAEQQSGVRYGCL